MDGRMHQLLLTGGEKPDYEYHVISDGGRLPVLNTIPMFFKNSILGTWLPKIKTTLSRLLTTTAIGPSPGQWDRSRSDLHHLPPASCLECGHSGRKWGALVDHRLEKHNPRYRNL